MTLLLACETRGPLGPEVAGREPSGTPSAEAAANTAPAAVIPPDISFLIVSTTLEEADPGWDTLIVDMALENRTSEWVMVEDAAGGFIRSAEGEEWDLIWSGMPGELPPGFRVRVDQERQPLHVTGRVPTGSSGHELDLVYSAYPAGLDPVDEGYRGLHQRLPTQPEADTLSYPFATAGGWEAYRVQLAGQMLILEPGETLNAPVYALSADEVRSMPGGGPTQHFEFDLSLVNARGGNLVDLDLEGDIWTSTGFAARVEATCRIEWGAMRECTVRSGRLASEAGEVEPVCLLLRDLRWSVDGLPERGSLEQPLIVRFP
jgi:hypothetical protein